MSSTAWIWIIRTIGFSFKKSWKRFIYFILICCATLVLAVATSCGDDEDDYAPDNVNDPEKLTDPLPTTDQLGVTHNNTLYYLSFWSKEDHMISENMDKPLQGGGSLCSGKEDGGWRHVLLYPAGHWPDSVGYRICWLTSRICSISGASWWWWREERNEDFNTVCTLLDCYNPYAKEDESYSDDCRCGYFLDRFRRRADSIPSSMRSVLLPELMAKNLYRRLMNTGRDFIATWQVKVYKEPWNRKLRQTVRRIWKTWYLPISLSVKIAIPHLLFMDMKVKGQPIIFK